MNGSEPKASDTPNLRSGSEPKASDTDSATPEEGASEASD